MESSTRTWPQVLAVHKDHACTVVTFHRAAELVPVVDSDDDIVTVISTSDTFVLVRPRGLIVDIGREVERTPGFWDDFVYWYVENYT